MKAYLWNILVGMDQSFGTLWGIHCDLTVSGWVGYRYPGSLYERLLDKVFGAGHCQASIEWDVIERLRKQGLIS